MSVDMLDREFLRDLVERAIRAFVVAFLVATIAVPNLFEADIAVWQGALTAAVHAAITAVLAVLTRPVGDRDTASVRRRFRG